MKPVAPAPRGPGEYCPSRGRCRRSLFGSAVTAASVVLVFALATPAQADEAETEAAILDPAAGDPGGMGQPTPPPFETAPAAPSSGLKLGGAIRGRYDLRFNNVGSDGQRRTSSNLSFDTLILKADYDSPTFFGAAQYRFYGGSFLYGKASGYHNYPGEISFPVYAYAGAKLSKQDKVAVGIQPVPFDDQFWGSAFLNSMGFVIGLEEVYNAGITYTHEEPAFKIEAGFFPTTAPNAFGISEDAARYSVNIVKGDPANPLASRNAERNMMVGHAQYRLSSSATGEVSVSGSAWLSTVHNFDTDRDGWRRAFAVSVKAIEGPWHAKLLAARQDMSLRNPGSEQTVTVGNFDAPFNIAADGTLLFGEVGRKVETGGFPFSLQVFANYAYFAKARAEFKDSQRLDLGAYWADKATGRIRIWSELLVGRNDPFIGAGQYATGAAQGGDDHLKVSFLAVFGYYF
ncbi:hypothetical protein EDF58_10450 [Novosphingobium sp. PhB57]|nr:hypothetical protein EDF58_10450 [Novosphingobium sp. PhB57]